MKHFRIQHGFTLIELLLALTVSGLLLALMSQAFFQITRNWDSRFERQEALATASYRLFLVERALRNSIPFTNPLEQKASALLFIGGEDQITWVTAQPVWHDKLALAQLKKTADTANTQWLYTERPISNTFDAAPTSAARTLMLEAPSRLTLRYLGFQSLDERLNLLSQSPPPAAEWRSTFDGTEQQHLPLAVELVNTQMQPWLHVSLPHTDLRYVNRGEL